MRLLALLTLFIAASTATAQIAESPRPEPPKWSEFKSQPGALLRLTSAQPATWTLVDAEGADVESVDGGKRLLFTSAVPGRYRLLAQSADETFRVLVVVGNPPAPPQPKPPEPLPPPKPVDPAQREFQSAYDADTRQLDKKRPDLLDLIELYKQAADLAAKPDVTTTGQLVARIREASRILAIEGLADLRKLISTRLMAAFPNDEPLTDATRKKAAEAFAQIRTLLQGVSP